MKRHFYRLQVIICVTLFFIWSSLRFFDNRTEELRALKNRISMIEDSQRRTGTQLCDLLNSIDNIKLDDRPDDKSVNNIQLQLSQIKTNLTRLALPGPINFIPHLNQHSKLEAAVHLGNLSPNIEFIIGIPTVKRDVQSYLMNTLKSLFEGITAQDSFAIIIYVGDLDQDYINKVGLEISTAFPTQFNAGQIEIISPPEYYYPHFEEEIDKLTRDVNFFNTFGDKPDRDRKSVV